MWTRAPAEQIRGKTKQNKKTLRWILWANNNNLPHFLGVLLFAKTSCKRKPAEGGRKQWNDTYRRAEEEEEEKRRREKKNEWERERVISTIRSVARPIPASVDVGKRSGRGNESAAASPRFIQTMTYNAVIILALNHCCECVCACTCVCLRARMKRHRRGPFLSNRMYTFHSSACTKKNGKKSNIRWNLTHHALQRQSFTFQLCVFSIHWKSWVGSSTHRAQSMIMSFYNLATHMEVTWMSNAGGKRGVTVKIHRCGTFMWKNTFFFLFSTTK